MTAHIAFKPIDEMANVQLAEVEDASAIGDNGAKPR